MVSFGAFGGAARGATGWPEIGVLPAPHPSEGAIQGGARSAPTPVTTPAPRGGGQSFRARADYGKPRNPLGPGCVAPQRGTCPLACFCCSAWRCPFRVPGRRAPWGGLTPQPFERAAGEVRPLNPAPGCRRLGSVLGQGRLGPAAVTSRSKATVIVELRGRVRPSQRAHPGYILLHSSSGTRVEGPRAHIGSS